MLFSQLRNQALDGFVRCFQSLGDCRALWNEWRLRIEHDDPADLSFKRQQIEEQSVFLEREIIHACGVPLRG